MTISQFNFEKLLVIAIGKVFIEQDNTSDFVTGRGDFVILHKMKIATIKI